MGSGLFQYLNVSYRLLDEFLSVLDKQALEIVRNLLTCEVINRSICILPNLYTCYTRSIEISLNSFRFCTTDSFNIHSCCCEGNNRTSFIYVSCITCIINNSGKLRSQATVWSSNIRLATEFKATKS